MEAGHDKAVLGIRSEGGGGGFIDGHAWITVRRGNGQVQDYGLWPEDHPAVPNMAMHRHPPRQEAEFQTACGSLLHLDS
jgi:hypothetical protein